MKTTSICMLAAMAGSAFCHPAKQATPPPPKGENRGQGIPHPVRPFPLKPTMTNLASLVSVLQNPPTATATSPTATATSQINMPPNILAEPVPPTKEFLKRYFGLVPVLEEYKKDCLHLKVIPADSPQRCKDLRSIIELAGYVEADWNVKPKGLPKVGSLKVWIHKVQVCNATEKPIPGAIPLPYPFPFPVKGSGRPFGPGGNPKSKKPRPGFGLRSAQGECEMQDMMTLPVERNATENSLWAMIDA
ncbi:hypothetical protein BT63DRAFT_462461 [Microthyrium microscopicum]|uniref:Uncharacterized protein n=1 Tax=Microthyrium microscopicum TaxID=703497 RepID=A0A6A6URN0_9PEZI|nr:hypothetical protein BT63DRAFT_462461 [Microthyrium microscopicum]